MDYIEWLRRRIGHRKTILVYATIVVRDDDGRILLQQRSDFDWWGLPGGILEPGEDIIGCGRRELREETGLETGPLRLAGIYSHPRYDVTYPNGDEAQQFSVTFEGQRVGGTAEPDGDEILSLAFFSAEETEVLAIPVWYRTMIRDVVGGRAAVFDQPDDGYHPTEPLPEWQVPGVILPAAVAVVQRDDGRLYMPIDHQGVRHFPTRPMRLGETVAETAVGAAIGQGIAAVPERLLGIVSAVEDGERTGTSQTVAAVLLLRAGTQGHESGAWVRPEALAAIAGVDSALARQVAATLPGGTFVDAVVEAARGPRVRG